MYRRNNVENLDVTNEEDNGVVKVKWLYNQMYSSDDF